MNVLLNKCIYFQCILFEGCELLLLSMMDRSIVWCLVFVCIAVPPIFGQHILILGGNGLMGAATVQKLIGNVEKITVMVRGNWYWDTEVKIKPFCEVLICDRKKPLRFCKDLTEAMDNDDLIFDSVVDFSGFRGEFVKEVTDYLGPKIGRYIYISSDSTYEVCMKNHTGLTVEADSVRPFDPNEREQYSNRDIYVHRKLEGEEVLAAQRTKGGVPYISLRLPDVVGPRDNTHRWWLYQVWITLGDFLDRSLAVPESVMYTKLSFVYTEDVADLILMLLHADLELFDQPYNVACEESLTLVELLQLMKNELDVHPETHIDYSGKGLMYWPSEPMQMQYDFPELTGEGNREWPDSLYMFPSITNGPINIGKAKSKLNWSPTPFHQVVKETIQWYESAMREDEYYKEKGELITILVNRFSREKSKVFAGLKEKYSYMEFQPKSAKSRDEL